MFFSFINRMKYFETLKAKIFKKPEQEKFLEVFPRVYAFNFPSEEKKHQIKSNLSKITVDYKIWNVSEYTYPAEFFDYNVSDYSRPGYPCPPIQDLLIMVKEMAHWLDSKATNLLLIHCQPNYSRTTLVLSCLFYFLRVEKEILAIEDRVQSVLSSTLLGNQRLYLKYFESCLNSVKLNRNPIILKRIILSETPFIKYQKEHVEDPLFNQNISFKPYVQIFLGKQIVYNSLQKYS